MDWNRKSVEERIVKRTVIDANGCWIWQGAISPQGYGKMSVDGRPTYAHRAAYEEYEGPIPEGSHIDHLCRVRACVNPNHLQPVTNRENARRGNAGKHMQNGGAPRGVGHYRAKMDDDRVRQVRALAGEGMPQQAIADRFGISQATVWQIVTRRTWRHV